MNALPKIKIISTFILILAVSVLVLGYVNSNVSAQSACDGPNPPAPCANAGNQPPSSPAGTGDCSSPNPPTPCSNAGQNPIFDPTNPTGGTTNNPTAGTGNAQANEADGKDPNTTSQAQQDEDAKECTIELQQKTQQESTGRFVPVQEVPGQLLGFTQDTNKLTTDNRDLLMKICVNTKALKRIQQRSENENFVVNPDVRRAGAQAVADYASQLTNWTQNSYPGSSGPEMYVKDWDKYERERANEAVAKVVAQVKDSPSYFQEDIIKTINEEDATDLTKALECRGATKEELTKFFNHEKLFEDQAQDTKRRSELILLTMVEPACNPNGAYLLTREAVNAAKAQEQKRLELEYLASGGLKRTGKCLKQADSGTGESICLQWENNIPASLPENALNRALGATVDRATNPQPGDIYDGNLPLLSQVSDLQPPRGPQGGNGIQPSGGTGGTGTGGGTTGTGGNTGQTSLNLNSFLNLFNQNKPTGSNPASATDPRLTNFSIPPVIMAFFTTPQAADLVDSDEPNHAIVYWAAPNATKCTTGNVWLGGAQTDDAVEVIHDQNYTLKNIDKQIIYDLPYQSLVVLRRTREVVTVNNLLAPDQTELQTENLLSAVASSTDPQMLIQTNTITFRSSDIQNKDQLSIDIKQAGGGFESLAVTVDSNASPAEVVQAFQNAYITTSDNKLKNYKFEFNTSTGTIKISVEPKYVIRCENNAGVRESTVTISRN